MKLNDRGFEPRTFREQDRGPMLGERDNQLHQSSLVMDLLRVMQYKQ